MLHTIEIISETQHSYWVNGWNSFLITEIHWKTYCKCTASVSTLPSLIWRNSEARHCLPVLVGDVWEWMRPGEIPRYGFIWLPPLQHLLNTGHNNYWMSRAPTIHQAVQHSTSDQRWRFLNIGIIVDDKQQKW